MRAILIILFYFVAISGTTSAQELIYSQSFGKRSLPADWTYIQKGELCHLLGVNRSDYFRFHPRQTRSVAELPVQSLSGNYSLAYSWNKDGHYGEDSVLVKVFKGDGNGFTKVATLRESTERNWQRDSIDLGMLDFNEVRVQFEFLGSGKFPAPYISLDEIRLWRTGALTGLEDNTASWMLSIWPNPAGSVAFLEMSNPEKEEMYLEVLDLTGRQLQQFHLGQEAQIKHSLDLEGLSAGMYWLLFRSNGRSSAHKIIVN